MPALRSALALITLVAIALGPAAPAYGHARLLSSNPAGGSTVEEAPQRLVLKFSEPIEPEFSRVQVRDPDGERVDAGAPRVDGDRVVTRLAPIVQAGTYEVAFRVISADGHPIESSFSFDVARSAVQAPADPTPEPTAEPTEPAQPAEDPPATEAATDQATDPAAIDDAEPTAQRRSAVPTVLIVVAAAVLLAGGVYVAVKRLTAGSGQA